MRFPKIKNRDMAKMQEKGTMASSSHNLRIYECDFEEKKNFEDYMKVLLVSKDIEGGGLNSTKC